MLNNFKYINIYRSDFAIGKYIIPIKYVEVIKKFINITCNKQLYFTLSSLYKTKYIDDIRQHFVIHYTPSFYVSNYREMIFQCWDENDHYTLIEYYKEILDYFNIKNIISKHTKNYFFNDLENLTKLNFEDMYKESVLENVLK